MTYGLFGNIGANFCCGSNCATQTNTLAGCPCQQHATMAASANARLMRFEAERSAFVKGRAKYGESFIGFNDRGGPIIWRKTTIPKTGKGK